MNINTNNNSSNDMNIPFYQDHCLSFTNQHLQTIEQELECAREQNEKKKKKKKCHGNRKLQRYRRKLRQRGINTSIDTESSVVQENIQQNERTIIGSTTDGETSLSVKSVQHKITKKKKCNTNKQSSFINKNNIHQVDQFEFVRNDSVDYTIISNEILYQSTAPAFNLSPKFNGLFSADEKIQIIRQYISLIDQVCFQQLKQIQWKYYLHLGLTQGIWHGHMSKTSAEKYSICHTYGRSKSVIEQRIRVIEKHFKQAQDAIIQFEQKILSECEQNQDCLKVLKELNTIIYQLVQEKQQIVKDKFEYQRKMLLFNATDHQLLQNFFDIEPNNRHITWARHIWKATKDQLIIEEDIALLQHRLISTTLKSTSDLLHKIINNINTNIQKFNDTLTKSTATYTSSNCIETLITLKKDIIQEAIFIHQKEHEQIQTIIHTEQNKFFVQNRYMESTSEYQKRVNEAIEKRRQHMLVRANYAKQFLLSASFNLTHHRSSTNDS
ncbi:unnamed protein product [Adineta ricciae]|uniref:Uncharacterized protein n=1 Tax=Adineta ricciae TaxID=249248 RepID=A0A816A8Z1_ADIRI|nr:unnamed protein product [Adineta ricciae]CAF1592557.1 unnamed protein product [Adineta ricciae]